MIKLFTSIVSLVGYIKDIVPALFKMYAQWYRNRQAKLDAEAIKNAKKAKTPEERRKAAKDLLDRTNS